MRPRKVISESAQEQLSELLKQAKSIEEFKRIQSVWLRAALNLSVKDISTAIGLAASSVRCFHSRFIKGGEVALKGKGRGGRKHQNLSLAEEKKFLSDFIAKAESGSMLVVNEVKTAYEKAVQHKVPKSTIYRMLARHGWRKLAPRPRHPKQDVVKQEEFKKNCLNR